MTNSANNADKRNDGRITFVRFTVVYTIAGLLAAVALVLPETTDNPTHYRIVYSIWATTTLVIPVVATFAFANVSARARAYWSLFNTAAFLVYLIHFYYAVFVRFGGLTGTIEGQGPLIAWGNFILTALWLIDVIVTWTATRKDYKVWNRHLLTLIVILAAFLFFAVIRNDGVVRWIGIALTATVVVSAVARSIFGRRIRSKAKADEVDENQPRECYFRGSLEAETAYFDRFIRDINLVQRRIRDGYYPAPIRRAFHAKQHLGISNAKLMIRDDIPNDLRISLFANPQTYDATVRLSSAAGAVQADAKKGFRGLALRVHLDDSNAHDFLATNAPGSHARDAYQFMAVAVAGSKRFRFLFPLRLLLAVGLIETVRILWVVLKSRTRVPSLATETYWSRAAIQVGDTAVRYLFVPQNSPVGSIREDQPDYLRSELVNQLEQGDIRFDLMFQRFVNEKCTPIEDSSIVWTESASPPIKVAELMIPRQTLNCAASNGAEAKVNAVDFNPWRTTPELRPLGSQNRARQLVYKGSADFRLRRKQIEKPTLWIELPIRAITPVFAFINRFIPWHRLRLRLLEVLNLDTFRHLLRDRNLYDADPAPRLVADTVIVPFDHSKTLARQSDGTYNDLTDPNMGKAASTFGRNVPPEKLVVPTPRIVLSPNPRVISRELHARQTFIPATTLNVTAAAWIQFQVHGWFNHTKLNKVFRTDQHWEVELTSDDPWRQYEDPMRIPKTPAQGRMPGGVPTFHNTESHWWDASQIYGHSENKTRGLRQLERGYMKMDGDLLPVVTPLRDMRFDLTGFNDNYWLGLSLMHTIFVKEHNAICDRLIEEFPARRDDDEWLFGKARLINAALMAKIHTVEWTPGILGRESLRTSMRANWWGVLGEQFRETFGRVSESEEVSGIIGSYANHHTAPYSLTEDFVTVYRMHPLIPDEFVLADSRDGADERHLPFAEVNAGATREVMESMNQADLWYSLGIAHPGAITLRNYPNQLRDLVVMKDKHIDLATIDNVRDRERALPRYNDFRRHLRMAPIKRWKDITADQDLAVTIKDIYGGDLERVDVMVGLHAETPPAGFGFSDTAFRIFILMASRRLKSDRFYTNDYNEETYTQPGLDWIRDNLMTDVLLRHFPQLQPALQGLGNAFVPWNPVAPAARNDQHAEATS